MGGREAESKAVNPGRLLDSFLERPWILKKKRPPLFFGLFSEQKLLFVPSEAWKHEIVFFSHEQKHL